jgi:hypothetical protein
MPKRDPEARTGLEDFVETALSKSLWFLRGRTGIEIPSSQRPGAWVLPLWTRSADARPTGKEVARPDQLVEPTCVPVEQLVEDWLPRMHEDGVVVGISRDDRPCEWEVEPLTLLAALAARSPDVKRLVARMSADVRRALAKAPEDPIGRWKGWPKSSGARRRDDEEE